MATSTDVLQAVFAFKDFRPGQSDVVAHILAGRSTAAVFPTGSGKSLCYQLPALLLPGLTLVVSPLIALMKDQVDQLKARGVTAERLDSSLAAEDVSAIMAAVRGGRVKLLYVAPERFNNERFLGQVRRSRIALFAIDEAHCISEWGHNFRPDYLKLAQVVASGQLVLGDGELGSQGMLEHIGEQTCEGHSCRGVAVGEVLECGNVVGARKQFADAL